jgi:hypothetical protein
VLMPLTARLADRRCDHRPATVRPWPSRGRARETEEGDDRWGPRVSEKEGEHARARAGRADGPRCWAARVGKRGRKRASGPFGWADRRKKSVRVEFFFFFFKNVNSNSICLFHLKFCRAPKIVRNFV